MAGESRYSKALLTAETIPHTGYLLPWDSSADSAMKTIDPALLNPFWYYKQDITAWNMQTNVLKSITITAGVAAYVSHVEKVVIYDDNGLIYDGSSVYDRTQHSQPIVRAKITGGSFAATTSNNNGSENIIVQVVTCDHGSGSVTRIDDYLGQNVITSITRIATGRFQVNHTYANPYRVNINPIRLADTGGYPYAASFSMEYGSGYFIVNLKQDDGSYINSSFTAQMFGFTSGSSHQHTITLATGSVIGNMNLGICNITSQLDKTAGIVKLAINNYGTYTNYETSGFGSTVSINAGQMADYTSITGNRGYIVLAMNYAT